MKQKDAVLLLLGDGELYDDIKNLADKDEIILGRVSFLGYRRDVDNLLNAADVFVLPSFVEGFPVSVVEAQANGIPCIVSDATPSEAAVTDLVTHISLSDSPCIWAEKILDIQAKHEREHYSSIVASKGFDISMAVKRMVEEYYIR